MRYGDGGGLNQAGRARREQVRLRAGELFADGVPAVEVAGLLEVSTKSAYRWWRAWAAQGPQALASQRPTRSGPELDRPTARPAQARLEQGPAAAGYDQDQRWTLNRIRALIATMFHVRVSVTTVWQTMRRLGYTAQLPAHRAAERDEQAITHWRRYRWPGLKESPAA